MPESVRLEWQTNHSLCFRAAESSRKDRHCSNNHASKYKVANISALKEDTKYAEKTEQGAIIKCRVI